MQTKHFSEPRPIALAPAADKADAPLASWVAWILSGRGEPAWDKFLGMFGVLMHERNRHSIVVKVLCLCGKLGQQIVHGLVTIVPSRTDAHKEQPSGERMP